MYKNFIENKKAVLFDLDGTIIDTDIYWLNAANNILRKSGITNVIAETYFVMGESLEKNWNKLLKDSGGKVQIPVKDLVEYTNNEYIEIIKNSRLEPRNGFWETIAEFKLEKKLKVALVTNTSKTVTTEILKKLDLENAFDFMIYGDEVKNPKPNPEIYLKTAEHFKIKPEQCLVFEDSVAGVQAAITAKMDVVVIGKRRSDYPKEILYIMEDFSSIPGSLETTYGEDVQNYLLEIGNTLVKQNDQKEPK